MQRQVCNQAVMVEVSKELGLPLKTVKDIIVSQSEFTRSIMESNTFDSVRLVYLGLLRCKPKELQLINHINGMTPEQAEDFKKKVRTGKIRLNTWEDE